MSISIYDFFDYRAYLSGYLWNLPKKGYGFKNSMAQAMRCQNAYVSRILAGSAELSLEQASALNPLLGHSDEEAHYFLLIVQYTKAGTRDLRSYFRKQIDAIRSERLTVSGRIASEVPLDEAAQTRYFSHWLYAAIHVLISIPRFQTREELASHLALPVKTISTILQFLQDCGLVAFEKGRYAVGSRRIHLGTHSPLLSKHHGNWRVQALRSLEKDESTDTHYSSVISVSEADLDRVKAVFLDAIEKANAIVKDSRDEMGACIALDIFQI